MMNIEVNGTNIQVKLYDNSSAAAVKELLRKGPLTIPMKDYAKMEKFGSFLPMTSILPRKPVM